MYRVSLCPCSCYRASGLTVDGVRLGLVEASGCSVLKDECFPERVALSSFLEGVRRKGFLTQELVEKLFN